MNGNPYNWQSHMPQVKIPRPDVDFAVKTALRNGSAVFMSGRGMGKSVFLRQVRIALEQEPNTRVLLLVGPPPPLSVESCLTHLAQSLGVDRGRGPYPLELFDRYLTQPGAPERLVLLFDDLDLYAPKG